MKKIISLIAAFSMACSVLATSAFAFATESVVIETSTNKLTNEEFYDVYGEDIPAGQEAYVLSFEVSGLADSLKYSKTGGTNAKPKYTGNALDNMEIFLYTEDDMSVINQDYSYIAAHSLSAEPTNGFGDGYWSANYSGNFIYPAAKDVEGVEEGSTVGYMQMYFVIDEGASVTFKNADGNIGFLSYSNGTITGEAKFSNVTDSNLTFAQSEIVIGESVPSGKGTEVKNGDAVIGTVWNEVVFEDVANTEYKLIFTDAEGNTKPGEGDIDFGELSGDVTVAVVLKSARAGVTLEVVGTPIAE